MTAGEAMLWALVLAPAVAGTALLSIAVQLPPVRDRMRATLTGLDHDLPVELSGVTRTSVICRCRLRSEERPVLISDR